MASPVLSTRLRIPEYRAYAQAFTGAPVAAGALDLIFRLQTNRIQKDISDQSKILVFPGFRTRTLAFSQINMVITLDGLVMDDGTHTAHAVSSGVEHDPDFIDLEEAAVLWNNNVKVETPGDTYPELQLQYGKKYDVAAAAAPSVDDWRRYKGVIMELTMTRLAGHVAVPFHLVFGVTWVLTLPGLREWAT